MQRKMITLDKQHTEIAREIAARFGVSCERLLDMYIAVAKANFCQDLWDIAKENLEELGEGDNYGSEV